MRHLIVIFIFTGLTACSLNVQQTRYYSLNLLQRNEIEIIKPNKQLITIHPVELPQFLNQDKLVMQLGNHQLYFAEYHRWAEPLAKEISQLIRQELSGKNEDFEFRELASLINQPGSLRLHINIDSFHPTDQSQVVLSGRYWIVKQDKTIAIEKVFHITDSLIEDGYLHAVIKLQQAIKTLSLAINNSLAELKVAD